MKRAHLILVVVVLAYSLINIATGMPLPNFSPLPALVFCCASAFLGATRWALPLAGLLGWAALVATQAPALDSKFWSGMGLLGLAYGVIFLLGQASRSIKGRWLLFLVSLSAPLAFYLITNLTSFALDPRYAKSLLGLTQALWTGIPTDPFPPTYVFLRNSLMANGLFSFAFYLSTLPARSAATKEVEAPTQLSRS